MKYIYKRQMKMKCVRISGGERTLYSVEIDKRLMQIMKPKNTFEKRALKFYLAVIK